MCKEARTGIVPGRLVVRGQNPPDDILINKDTESQGQLFSNARTPPTWVALFHLNNCLDQILIRPFGSWL